MRQLTISTLLFLCAYSAHAQIPFTLHLETTDTASSIFSQNRFRLTSSEIPVNDTTGEPLYLLKAVVDSTDFVLKFPNSNWISIKRKEDAGAYREEYYHTITNRINVGHYINLFYIYAENPGLFEDTKDGATIQFRFRMYASLNNGPYTDIYSNIENIYLPPANADDIGGFNYIKANIKRIWDFETLDHPDYDTNHDWEYIRTRFPNSVIHDMADYFIIMYTEYDEKRQILGNGLAFRQWIINRYTGMLSTKSDRLRDNLEQSIYSLEHR